MTGGDAVLVIGPSWVGDMVMAQVMLRILSQDQPGVAIDVLAPPWSLPLLARMPEVRRAIPLPVGHGELGLATRWHLGRGLRGAYGQAIVLPNSLKSALIPWFAAIPRRTGFVGEMRFGLLNDARRLDKRRWPRTVDRFSVLARPQGASLPNPLPQPRLHADPEAGHAILARFAGTETTAPLLALCPGAEYGPAKRWPVDFFTRLAHDMTMEGWRVVVLGSAKETDLGEEILAGEMPGAINLAGRIALEEALDVLALADAVVTNDSGLMHVAAALDRPGVAIFGSSDPAHTPPLGGRLQILSLGLPCAPCFKRECPLGHLDCLRKITPEQVKNALNR
ncbi:MAG: lipopolysaccharide heptosyltransferase II [Magnetococcales bacterium]|nr:lipopolysaccharide heptosyltransferase II [Magnetococcales bacterium]